MAVPLRGASMHFVGCAASRVSTSSSYCSKAPSILRMSPFWGAELSSGPSAVHGSPKDRRGGHTAVEIEAKKRSGFADLFARRNLDQQEVELAVKRAPQPLRPGKVSPRLPVPSHIPRPSYADSGVQPPWNDEYQVQDAVGIDRMRAAGKLAAQVLEYAGTLVRPGLATDEIDKAVHKAIVDAGAYPSPLNYGKFPKSVCTSVNECVCHGIPDSRLLLDGDIINIDVTVFLNGYHGDTSKTFFCGNVTPEARKLVEVTEEALDRAISICRPGQEVRMIGKVIHDLADEHKYGVVRQFVGHGVGRIFHSGPVVQHFRNNDSGVMAVGQTFTIEPMLTLGKIDCEMWNDNWTIVTKDRSLSAQFEHTLLITESGAEVLTKC